MRLFAPQILDEDQSAERAARYTRVAKAIAGLAEPEAAPVKIRRRIRSASMQTRLGLGIWKSSPTRSVLPAMQPGRHPTVAGYGDTALRVEA
jgi:hypothetical protein